MLDLAYFQKERLLLTGLFITIGRRTILEQRILNVLSMKRNNLSKKGGKKMRFRGSVLCLVSILAVIVLIGSCATTKKAISGEDFFEVWSGIWINTDYSGGSLFEPQKLINYPDGRWEGYSLVTLDQWSCYGKDTMIDMWTDPKGDIWYKASWYDNLSTKGYTMGKISDSGNTLETLVRLWGEPIEEWDPDDIRYHYTIHYRQ
jgi:hypothetical protein